LIRGTLDQAHANPNEIRLAQLREERRFTLDV
jgi:hypothetical protein